jgi:hypothetical protein
VQHAADAEPTGVGGTTPESPPAVVAKHRTGTEGHTLGDVDSPVPERNDVARPT